MNSASLKFIVDFLLFSSLFISGCAVVMVYQTVQLLGLPALNSDFYAFVFWSTMASYNFHWSLTPTAYSSSQRIAWSQRHKSLEWGLFALSGLSAAYYLFFCHRYIGWISISVFLTFLYTAPKIPLVPFTYLRKIAVGKTLFLTSVWTYITAVLPVLIAGIPLHWSVLQWTMHRFFLIYAICILFDYRDREQDREAGIRSLVTYLSDKGNDRLFYASLGLALLSVMTLFGGLFSGVVVSALCGPILILAWIYPRAKKSRSDYLYYFVLDGLMAISACLTYFLY
jgi:4-hydroxybenzoate polyprenyltransferase